MVVEKEREPTLGDVISAIKQLADSQETLSKGQKESEQRIDKIIGVINEGTELEKEDDGDGRDNKKVQYEGNLDGQAKVELGRLVFDTPPSKLPELTETPRFLVTPTSFIEAKNEYFENIKQDKLEGGKGKSHERLSSIFIRRKDSRMKSVGRKSLMEAMAFAQIQQQQADTPLGSVLDT